jgi:molybdate-binding protein
VDAEVMEKRGCNSIRIVKGYRREDGVILC